MVVHHCAFIVHVTTQFVTSTKSWTGHVVVFQQLCRLSEPSQGLHAHEQHVQNIICMNCFDGGCSVHYSHGST